MPATFRLATRCWILPSSWNTSWTRVRCGTWSHSSRRILSSAPSTTRSLADEPQWRPLDMSRPDRSNGTSDSHSRNKSPTVDIEDLHQQALLKRSTTYTDPSTGFVVFTERAHLLRGTCCGNQCRHCPYGWENVSSGVRQPAKVSSGDAEGVQALLAVQNAAAKARRTHQHQHQEDQRQSTQPKDDNAPTGGRHGGRLTDKNVPYTRTGDQGLSSLLTGERRSKADVAFEAMGTVDELCSFVGVVHAQLTHDSQSHLDNNDQVTVLTEHLLEIMSRLFDIGSHVAKPRRVKSSSRDNKDDASASWSSCEEDTSSGDEESRFVADGIGGGFDAAHVQVLEDWIDLLTQDLPELTSFLLPTGSLLAAHLHTARTVCRRAERRMVPLVQAGVCDPNALKYVNRLSDYLFTLARYANVVLAQQEEIQYRKPHKGATQRERRVN